MGARLRRDAGGEEWFKTAEVRAALGEPVPSVSSVTRALRCLAEREEIERDPPMDAANKDKTTKWRLSRA